MVMLMTRQKMEEKLEQVFAPEQTDSLVEVLDTIQQVELERAADTRDLKQGLTTLTEEVRKLTSAQQRTDERLAKFETRTDRRFAELAAAQQRTDERLAKFETRTDRRFAELAAAQQRTDESVARLSSAVERLAETTEQGMARLWDAVGHLQNEIGGLSNRFGFSLEEFVAALLPPYLERYDGITGLTLDRRYFELPEGLQEVDLVGSGQREGQPVMVLADCRAKIRGGELRKLAGKLEKIAETITTGEVVQMVVAMNIHPLAEAVAQETGVRVIPYSRINRERS